MELEQQRQMTIKAANVTLYYESKGIPYVINLIDKSFITEHQKGSTQERPDSPQVGKTR